MNTLLLDRTNWDLCVDVNGDIAMATLPYAAAQDAASACRLAQGDYWYNTTIGIPYLGKIMGQSPPLNLVRAQQRAAALSVPDVATSNVYYSSVTGGQLSGQVQVTDVDGNLSVATF